MHADGEPVGAEGAVCKGILMFSEWLIGLSGEWLVLALELH